MPNGVHDIVTASLGAGPLGHGVNKSQQQKTFGKLMTIPQKDIKRIGIR